MSRTQLYSWVSNANENDLNLINNLIVFGFYLKYSNILFQILVIKK